MRGMVLPEPPTELWAAANCAGAFLMLVAFVLLAVLAVALHLAWRGLMTARRSVPEAMGLAASEIDRLDTTTQRTTAAVVEPQVKVASRLAGLKAGLRALWRPPAPRPAVSPPAAAMPPLEPPDGLEP
jgi:hypothetical protein